MGFFDFLKPGYGNELKDRAKKQRRQYNQYEDDMESTLDRISAMGQQTTEERFGDSIDRVETQVNADRAGTQRAISRALMAGGGDITGEGATALSKVTETGNSVISDAIREYSDMNENMNQNLIRTELSGNQSLMNMKLGQLLNTEDLERQRRQSNKQLFADIIGGGATIAGGVLGGRKKTGAI